MSKRAASDELGRENALVPALSRLVLAPACEIHHNPSLRIRWTTKYTTTRAACKTDTQNHQQPPATEFILSHLVKVVRHHCPLRLVGAKSPIEQGKQFIVI